MSTFERLNECLKRDGLLTADSLDDSLEEDLCLDSLDRISLAIEIENEFGFAIPVSVMDNITTVRGVVAYIDKRLDDCDF